MRNPPSLRSGRDFRRVLESGRHAGRPGLIAVALPNSQPDEPSRLGLAVRCRGGAVERNRIKRRLRAAYRLLGPVGGYDVVVRADDRVIDTDFSSLLEEMGAALHQATGGRV